MALLCLGGACLPKGPEPAHYVLTPDAEVPPTADPADAELPIDPADAGAPPTLDPGGPETPPLQPELPGGGGTPPLTPPELPPPWTRDRMASPPLSPSLLRQVVATEQPVGVFTLGPGRHLVVERSGGLFSATDLRGWSPLPTDLQGPVLRAHAYDGGVLACRGAERPAMMGYPDGLDGIESMRWSSAGFACGHDGRRTVAVAGDTLLALHAGQLRVERPGEAPVLHPIPLDAPQVIAAVDDKRVIVLGADGVRVSYDGGVTFRQGVIPDAVVLDEVRDAHAFGKDAVVAVGVGAEGRPGVMLSENLGYRWRGISQPARGLEALEFVALDAVGAGVAVPQGGGPGIAVMPRALRWLPLEPFRGLTGAPLVVGSGQWWAPQSRGLVGGINVDAPPPPGLDQPLWRAIYLHPLVAVGAGLDEGLFTSTDGGRTWRRLPGTSGVRFRGLAHSGPGTFIATGPSNLWTADLWSQGGWSVQWQRAAAPSDCNVQWVSVAPEGDMVLAGCEAGAILRSIDGGAQWTWSATAEQPLAMPLWMPDGTLLALAKEGGSIYQSADDGITWQERGEATLALPGAAISLKRTDDGFSLLLADGRLARSTDIEGPWTVGPAIPRAFELHPLAGGADLVVAEGGVYRVERTLSVAQIIPAEEALASTLTGDGGVLVLTPSSTALWRPR
ncbi:MAG: hypothetical protein ACE366_29555 [Bradymonadia bacterium]